MITFDADGLKYPSTPKCIIPKAESMGSSTRKFRVNFQILNQPNLRYPSYCMPQDQDPRNGSSILIACDLMMTMLTGG